VALVLVLKDMDWTGIQIQQQLPSLLLQIPELVVVVVATLHLRALMILLGLVDQVL
jgi:hypothetical protein